MPKIVITEIDETTPGVVAESTDVVYIPGFVNLADDSLYNEKGEYVGIEVNTPTLFTNVSQFQSLCGYKPATFPSRQLYSFKQLEVTDPTTGTVTYETAFDSNCIPYHDVMFEAGAADPAYIMAKELLASGLNVVYERVNGADVYEPYVGVFKNTKGDFLYYDGSTKLKVYKRVYANSAQQKEAPEFKSNTYFQYIPSMMAENVHPMMYCEESDTTLNNYVNNIKDEMTGEPVLPEGFKLDDYWNSYVEQNSVYVIEEVSTDDGKAGFFECEHDYVTADTQVYVRTEVGDSITLNTMYSALTSIYDVSNAQGIVDRGNYSIKYLTSGGYPVFEYDGNSIASKMLKMAAERGDCVALIDHTNNITRTLNPNDVASVYTAIQNYAPEDGDFGTMFTPWITYNRITSDYEAWYEKDAKTNKRELKKDVIADNTKLTAPASFAYLTSLADSIKTNANWLAVAGVTRGGVRNISNMTTVIPNSVADDMQQRYDSVSVNAITKIKPYGDVIWGNRTLKKNAENLVATSFLNIRNLISDVKKTCYRVARSTTFEQDTDVLWMNFKNSIAATLDRMVSGYGISGYKIVRDNTHEKAKEKATICARIILYPTYAVEDFYITVVLKDADVTVE